jgi:hypothetical protein
MHSVTVHTQIDGSEKDLLISRQRTEIQELRARVLSLSAQLDDVSEAGLSLQVEAYLASRGFRLWQRYVALYEHPASAPIMRGLRRMGGAAYRSLRRSQR